MAQTQMAEPYRLWKKAPSIDALVEGLRTRHSSRVAKPLKSLQTVEERKFINASFVRASLQEHEDDATLEWYLDNFLFGKLAGMYVPSNGISKPLEQDEPQAPYMKLEILLRVAQHHRKMWIETEDEILSDDKYVKLHHAWQAD